MYCGMFFVFSKTNLFKHEKRCQALDAPIVLKARAVYVVNQAKGRREDHPDICVPKRQFLCPYCPDVFNIKAALVCHLKKHTEKKFIMRKHFDYSDKPYKCKICPFAFSDNKSLIIHDRMHKMGRPYQCDLCPKAYKTGSSLRVRW